MQKKKFFFLNLGMSKAYHNFFRFFAEVVSEKKGVTFTTFSLLNIPSGCGVNWAELVRDVRKGTVLHWHERE